MVSVVHADTHHHDPAVRWRVGDEGLQHAGHADGLEDDRILDVAPEHGGARPLHHGLGHAEVGPAVVG